MGAPVGTILSSSHILGFLFLAATPRILCQGNVFRPSRRSTLALSTLDLPGSRTWRSGCSCHHRLGWTIDPVWTRCRMGGGSHGTMVAGARAFHPFLTTGSPARHSFLRPRPNVLACPPRRLVGARLCRDPSQVEPSLERSPALSRLSHCGSRSAWDPRTGASARN